MKISESIYDLCLNKTFLDEDDIEKIVQASKFINIVADLDESDIFIDVLSRDKNSAIVIFHAIPTSKKSIYHHGVIGSKALRENEPGVLKTLETGVPCRDIKAINQENKKVKQKIQPIKNDNGEVIAVIIAEQDISEEINNDFKLNDSNHEIVNLIRLSEVNEVIANNLDDSILIFDNDGKLAISNRNSNELYRVLGYLEDINKLSYNNLSLDKMKFDDIIKVLEEKKKVVKELEFGNYFFKITRILVENDSRYKLVSVIRDITYIKEKEKEMKLKQVQIKEAHHRIKNNLNTAVALLRRESRRDLDDMSKKSIDSCISRILTIASTHDLLSKTSNSKVSVKRAIEAILNNISSLEDKKINIMIYGDDFEIYGVKSTALLLSINEIVINSFKHGFKYLDSGSITVTIKKNEENITISIKDDGEGYKTYKNDSNGLGSGIIESYVTEVLNGNIEMISDENGTENIIEFK